MNRERIVFSLGILRHFINGSFGLQRDTHSVSGFELAESLVDSAAYNTYLETIGNKADTFNLRAREAITEMATYSYLDYIRRLSEKFGWKAKEVMLAFDYTDEDFYGDVQGFDIHGWTGDKGVTGKFKFLTCSIVSDDIERIPIISVPIALGHYKSYTITHCLELVRQYIGPIKLILFDRGFYDKDLMYELQQNRFNYLIFVPKQKDKQELLYPLDKGSRVTIIWDYELNKDKTNYHFDSYLTFMKQIYDHKSDAAYDWVFATNVEEVALGNLIQDYKKRWNIETGFRVQDEARIRCKSTDMKIRYFLFIFEQVLQTQWVCFYKEEVSFKEFLIEMHKTCKDLVANPNKKYGRSIQA
mgnify:CR=1 FL=1